NVTVSLLNIYHLPSFFEHIENVLALSLDRVILSPVYDPHYYSITCLPLKQKKEIESMFQELNLPSSHLRAQLLGIIDYMNSSDDSRLLKSFYAITERLDMIRNQQLDKHCPELVKLKKEYL